MAVDDSERHAPTMIASEGLRLRAIAPPAINAVVSSTCRPPRPSTRRRMADNRASDSSRPIRNRRKTTPSSAKPETFSASVTVTQ